MNKFLLKPFTLFLFKKNETNLIQSIWLTYINYEDFILFNFLTVKKLNKIKSLNLFNKSFFKILLNQNFKKTFINQYF